MAEPVSPGPSGGLGASSELRRSVGKATERIHEIIDAAEKVADEIRSDAEREAELYLQERRREADRLVSERAAALESMSARLADTAERFKREAAQMLGELDAVIAEAKGSRPALAPEPVPQRESAPAPEPEPAPEAPKPVMFAYPGNREEPAEPAAAEPADAGDRGDATAEALLRATQMAVTGKDRDEIVATLRSDFPSVDAESVTDEILG